MKDTITRGEAAIFAMAVREAINSVKPVMPNMVILETVKKVDFKGDHIPAQVRAIVEQLSGRNPYVIRGEDA